MKVTYTGKAPMASRGKPWTPGQTQEVSEADAAYLTKTFPTLFKAEVKVVKPKVTKPAKVAVKKVVSEE